LSYKAEFVLGFDGRVIQVKCKIYTRIDDIDNILVPKLDSLWKHVGHHKVLVTMLKAKMGDDYIYIFKIHVANETLYF
jgi:hypothetical protein